MMPNINKLIHGVFPDKNPPFAITLAAPGKPLAFAGGFIFVFSREKLA